MMPVKKHKTTAVGNLNETLIHLDLAINWSKWQGLLG